MCLAVPGRIIEINDAADSLHRVAKVSFGGTIREINLACVPEAQIGDYILAHVGIALNVVDAEEAEKIFDYLRQMDDASGTKEEAL